MGDVKGRIREGQMEDVCALEVDAAVGHALGHGVLAGSVQDVVGYLRCRYAGLGYVFCKGRRDGARPGADVEELELRRLGSHFVQPRQQIRGAVFCGAPRVVLYLGRSVSGRVCLVGHFRMRVSHHNECLL